MAKKQHDHGRSHDRAKDKAQTSISMRADLLKEARRLAAEDNRSLSNWIEKLIQDATKGGMKIFLFGWIIAALFRRATQCPNFLEAAGQGFCDMAGATWYIGCIGFELAGMVLASFF